MSRNSNLLTHIKHDKNAIKHIYIGAVVGGIGALTHVAIMPSIAALAAGISIEVYQRLTGGKNTLRESVMDALTTALPGFIISGVMYV